MDLRERVDGSQEELLGELNEFLRMPSISARADENGGFRNCAEWVAEKLEGAAADQRQRQQRRDRGSLERGAAGRTRQPPLSGPRLMM